jgi:Flp pilus assembly protein TadD
MRKPPIPVFTLLRAAAFALAALPTFAAVEEAEEVARLHRAGDSAQALQLAEQVLAARPKDAQMRFLKGVVLAESQRGAEAMRVFESLTEDFPELAEPYNNLATLHAARGDYDRARVALEQALRSNPGYATAYENLGDVHGMLASRAYARALSLDPGSNRLPSKLALARELFGVGRTVSTPTTSR